MTEKVRLRKPTSKPEWFMNGKRSYRIAKKIADRNNRRRSILRLMLRAVYTPLLSAYDVRVLKAECGRARFSVKHRRAMHGALLKHKRAGYQGVIVRVKLPEVGFMQSVIVHQDKLEEYVRNNNVLSVRDADGERWLQPRILQTFP